MEKAQRALLCLRAAVYCLLGTKNSSVLWFQERWAPVNYFPQPHAAWSESNMPTISLNPFKSLDKYFLTCKIVTLLFCLPWPLTVLASVMSLAGYVPPNTPLYLRVLIRLGWLLALAYPAVFLAIVIFAERVLAQKSYAAAAMVALVPIVFSLCVVGWLFLT
jgi:hypothetical protein